MVIVLLTLLGVLFIGARAWKKGSYRSSCIVNIRSFQQGLRSYANFEDLDTGDIYNEADVVTSGFVEADQTCPLDSQPYILHTNNEDTTIIPASGILAKRCGNEVIEVHLPENFATW